MNIVLIIVFTILIILLLIPLIIIKFRGKLLNNSYMQTIGFVKNKLGFIISLNGPIGTGKTSAQSGLSHISQLLIIQDIQDLIDKTKMIFKNISFNAVDQMIHSYFSGFSFETKDKYPDFDYITSEVVSKFEINDNEYINNFLSNVSVRKYILDYCQALFVFYYRENYVQSNTPFYSHLTNNYNLDLNIDWLSIKEAYKKKDYAILDWVVILIDELTDEASAGMWQQDIKDISGAKEYRRKFRQLHQERNRLITTKQDVLDEVKKYRNLTHSHLILDDKVSTTGNYYFIYGFIKMIFSIMIFINKRFRLRFKYFLLKIFRKTKGIKFFEYYEYYLNETNFVRRFNNYLYYLYEFLTSVGYNRYYGKILKRAEDIERITAEAEEFYLFIPTMYCWGTYDTHLYRSMQSDLLNKSTTITKEVIPDLNPNFFAELDLNTTREKGDDNFEF